MKKPWVVIVIAVILLVAAGFAFYPGIARQLERKRQLNYQRITKSYSDALKRGTTRGEVEAYIRSKSQTFTQMCCVGADRKAWTDLIKIGEGTSASAPWICNATNVYVAFEFDTTEGGSTSKASDSDRLLNVTLFEEPQACL